MLNSDVFVKCIQTRTNSNNDPAQSKKIGIMRAVIVVSAMAGFRSAWRRTVWRGATKISATRFVENNVAEVNER